jgi:hypothetical protein
LYPPRENSSHLLFIYLFLLLCSFFVLFILSLLSFSFVYSSPPLRFQPSSSYIFLFSSTFLLLIFSSLQVEPERTETGRGRELERERLPEVERIPFFLFFFN